MIENDNPSSMGWVHWAFDGLLAIMLALGHLLYRGIEKRMDSLEEENRFDTKLVYERFDKMFDKIDEISKGTMGRLDDLSRQLQDRDRFLQHQLNTKEDRK